MNLMLQIALIKSFAQRVLPASPALLAAIFALQTQNAIAQSVLLSNLKTSEQASPASQGQRSVLTTGKPKMTEFSDPFLQPNAASKSPSRASSILQSSDVDETLISPQPNVSTGAHEDLDALLWLRTSAEYDALTRQAFVAATHKLGEAIVDPDWEAVVPSERANGSSKSTSNMRPPCVIVDVDETILDNSVFQVELIQSDSEYQLDAWNQFVQRRSSPAIEGAVEFVQACRASGVVVFFVTNRESTVEAATRENLIAQGLMATSDPDRILSKNEQPNWTSDKSSRRRAVAQKYRVVLLIGDDLNDFLSAKNLTIEQRSQFYQANKKNWGRSWFVIPNPNYGSWEQTTYGNDYQAPLEKKRELKMQTLSGGS